MCRFYTCTYVVPVLRHLPSFGGNEQYIAVIARIISARIPVIIFISSVSKVTCAAPMHTTALQTHAIPACFLEWQRRLTGFITIWHVHMRFSIVKPPSHHTTSCAERDAKSFWVDPQWKGHLPAVWETLLFPPSMIRVPSPFEGSQCRHQVL